MQEGILLTAAQTHSLTKAEIVSLLTSADKDLFAVADKVRQKYKGNDVHLRGLIEFTNICKQDCLYCGLRRSNKQVHRYRLSDEQIIQYANDASAVGYKTIVLQGGEDPHFTADRLASIIQKIKQNNIAITLSIGEMSYAEYEMLKEAGADRFLLRIETTDDVLYHKMSSEMRLSNRKQCLSDLRQCGFEVGTGCLVGLPEQTISSLADDILFFKEINADMVGIGPFIPNPDTPLRDTTAGDFWLALRVMAITRLLLPDINIPATTAMETLHPDGRLIALQSGANVIMPNVTQGGFSEHYALYPGKVRANNSLAEYRQYITQKIESIGRTVSSGYGFRG